MHSLGEVNFLIELVGFTVDLVILGIILYAYLREKEKEKYLLFWVIAYLLLIASVFLTLVFESKIIPRLIFLKQVFSISAGVVFLWGALGLKWGEKFKHKSEFLTLITFAVFVSVLSDFIFSEKWRYIVSLLFILLFFLIAGVRVILHARTAKMPSYRLFGLSLILFGLTTVANFISAISPEFVRLSLFFEQVLLTLLGVSILVIILDKYMVRTIQVEKLYRTVVDVMNEALVLLDTKLKITYINNRFGELMKCRSFDDLIGRKFIDFIPDRFHEIVLEKEKSIEAGLCSTYEIEIKDMEGNIHSVIVSSAPFAGEEGVFKGSVNIILDITERRKLEIQLQLASRLAEIGELSAGVAHNIKNPLQGIIFAAEILKKKNVEPNIVDIIMKQAQRINDIINNLQFKAIMDSRTDFQLFDLNLLLREELTFLQAHRFFKHEIDKNFNFCNEPLYVKGLYSDFSQIFTNIIKNAIDAMYRTERKVLTVKTQKDNGFAIVEITDTGTGIPDDILPKIWDMFFTTKPTIYTRSDTSEPVGTGIGLATVKRLAEKYNIQIDVKTRVGEGTSFILKIPLAEEQTKDGGSHNDKKNLA
ncbi:PAS domain S-box-containing protein [Candidatus Thermokryptus mobilis]|uniref:histidine kinase n=1 Tax=Candidatus Thermokryptus mobilis TaxID=1643428 RepID=A0A0S4N5T9_9BACT|nr:ATP-binding protein [Candidatus Thermokryptus mobilis]CUU06489.1 PAS domain S-box-containing protein [Candidatus Thermokryptus mobilis]